MIEQFDYVTVSSDEDDFLEICNWLKTMASSNQHLSLMNYYMEMPIVSKSPVTASDDRSFVVSPLEHHTKVITEIQKTIIHKSPELSVLANCQAISLSTNEVILSGFRYISLHANHRKTCRVRLQKPINVSLITETGKMAGVLKDISLSGCRVATFIRTLQPGASVVLALKMFDTSTNAIVSISVNAELIRVDNAKMPIACGFRFEPDSETEEKLIRFINQRQMELIKSLKDSLV